MPAIVTAAPSRGAGPGQAGGPGPTRSKEFSRGLAWTTETGMMCLTRRWPGTLTSKKELLVATTSGFASLPLYRKLALGAAVLLVVDLFLPWVTASISIPDVIDQTESGNGWDGVGVLAGILALALIAWEVARLLGVVPRLAVNHDLVTAVLAGLTALFTIIQFIRALTSGGDVDEAELLGGDIDAGAGYAAWIGLVLALVLAYVAYLAFSTGGGLEGIDGAREETVASAAEADRTQVEDSVADDLPTERPASEPPGSYPTTSYQTTADEYPTTAAEAVDEMPPTPPRRSDQPPMP
jgi:hypothetical protein